MTTMQNIGEIKISGKILWALAQFTSAELPHISILPQEEGIVLVAMNGHSAMLAYDRGGECSAMCSLCVEKSVASACKKANMFTITEEGRVWVNIVSKKMQVTKMELTSFEVVVKGELPQKVIDCVEKMLRAPTRGCEVIEAHFYGLMHVESQRNILDIMKVFGIRAHTTRQAILNDASPNSESALILEAPDAPHLIWITMPARLDEESQEGGSDRNLITAALSATRNQ